MFSTNIRLTIFAVAWPAFVSATADLRERECQDEEEGKTCNQQQAPRRGLSHIQISDLGVCKCAAAFEEAVAAENAKSSGKDTSFVQVDPSDYQVDWGWGDCAPFCLDNGCPCLKPWAERCLIKSCAECGPCTTPVPTEPPTPQPTNPQPTNPPGAAPVPPTAAPTAPRLAPTPGAALPPTIPPTAPPPLGPSGICMLAGDPHVKVFDLTNWKTEKWKAANFYDGGDFWIVNSPSVKIQGKLVGKGGTNGNAVVYSIAISGTFIDNNILVIEPQAGQVSWNSNSILTGLGQNEKYTHSSGTTTSIRYHNDPGWAGRRNKGMPPGVVDANLPLDMQVKSNRWNNHLDIMITMHAVSGQDGICGNFNGNPGDDSESSIKTRIGYPGLQVSPGDGLFSSSSSLVETRVGSREKGNRKAKDCKEGGADFGVAKNICEGEIGTASSEALVEACAHDVCALDEHFADQYIAASEDLTAETAKVEKKNEIALSCLGWCQISDTGERCKSPDTSDKVDVPNEVACQTLALEAGHLYFSFRYRTNINDPNKAAFCQTFASCENFQGTSYDWKVYQWIQ